MYRIYYVCFCVLMSAVVQAQDCEKAWMHYERRAALSAETAQNFGIQVPIEKIQIDFLGAPVGIPFNYTTQEYSSYHDHEQLEKDGRFRLHYEANKSLVEMQIRAQKEGIDLGLNNTYRSYSYQKYLHDKLGEHQAERPGYSEHHLATAIDLKAVNDQKFLWLLRNAFAFGWVPSYYFRESSKIKKEPWHWRYVGKLAAVKFRCAWESEIDRCIWKLKQK